MKNDYKTTKDWDEDLEGLIEGEPSLEKLRYWAIRIQIVYADRAKTSKGKPVIATIERVPDLYREITLLDYIIVIHKPCLAGFNRDQVRIAIFEQLLKIQIEEEIDGTEVHLPVPRAGYCGLYIEMKYEGGRLLKSQKDFLKMAAYWDNYCVVCYNATDAIEVIEAYLRNITKYDVLAVVKEGKRIGTVR